MPQNPLEWVTLDQQVAYTGSDFGVVHERVRLPDGSETEFDYVSEPECVCVLPLVADRDVVAETDTEPATDPDSNTVVTIEEWRQAVDHINFGLPVGNVEPTDDSLEAAARRELREETGYESSALEQLVTVEPLNGIADSVMHFFVARGCKPAGDQRLDDDESIRVTRTSLEDLADAVNAGDVRDGRTVLAVSYYLLFDAVSGGVDDRSEE